MTACKLISVGSTPCEHCNSGIQSYVGTGKGGIQSYLEMGKSYLEEDAPKKQRALACDYLNISPDRQHDWAKCMDETRHNYGNDGYRRWERDGVDRHSRPHEKGDKMPRRMWYHFTISPDPRDCCDLETLRTLCTRWADRFFGNAQVAIVYHDDNRHSIPHAHIVVNNTDLLSGNKLHIDKLQWRTMNTWLQRESKNLGLSWMEPERDDSKRPDRGASRAGRIVEECDRNWVMVAGDRRMAQGAAARAALQKRQVAMRRNRRNTRDPHRKPGKRGYEISWKQEIREWSRIAVNTCDGTWEGYVLQMARLNVRVEKKKYAPDVTYVHPNGMKVRGRTLGDDYDVAHIRGAIAKSLAKSGALGESEIGKLISMSKEIAYVDVPEGLTIADIEEMKAAAGCSLRDIAMALNIAGSMQAKTITDMTRMRARIEKWGPANKDGVVTDRMRAQWEGRLAAMDRAIDLMRMTKALPESEPRKRRSRYDRQDVPLWAKVQKGYRLSKEEYAHLKTNDPLAFELWQEAKKRRPIEERRKRKERIWSGATLTSEEHKNVVLSDVPVWRKARAEAIARAHERYVPSRADYLEAEIERQTALAGDGANKYVVEERARCEIRHMAPSSGGGHTDDGHDHAAPAHVR